MDEEAVASHRKRLAQILRYIASWHLALHSGDAGGNHSFVRVEEATQDFYQTDETEEDCASVLFSTQNFRTLLQWEEAEEEALFPSPPFSFYAASSSSSLSDSNVQTSPGDRKRSLTGLLKKNNSVSPISRIPRSPEAVCWLRLTRLTRAQRLEEPLPHHAAVQAFLDDWMQRPKMKAMTYQELLSSPARINRELDQHPPRPIRVFLKRYKRYLLTNRYQQALEPMYNRLFEWIQQQDQNNQELVWSLGHAKYSDPSTSTYIDGPLLDVLVEVDLAPDGALLVKPRQHTGVTLNRQVVSALSNSPEVLSRWHRRIAQLEASQLSPGQPPTYVKILKQLTVELCPDGNFQASAKSTVANSSSPAKGRRRQSRDSSLLVTEAWCLYSRLKPTTVWARDANLLADQLSYNDQELSLAAWSLTHGPNVLEQVNSKGIVQRSHPSPLAKAAISFLNWLPGIAGSSPPMTKSCRPMFPLATSDSQNQIAQLLLDKKYPAVVTEGPPGTGKTHSIANIVCAYLCQGKRVLVTSKNAPALSVLRDRLPSSVQELCVDVSKSESSGLRQLRQTVERLANRVSAASVEIESQKSRLLKKNIGKLDERLESIDASIRAQSDNVRNVLQGPDGIKLAEIASKLMKEAPWLMYSLESLSFKELIYILDRVKELEVTDESILGVENFDSPPKSELISMVLAKSGSCISSSMSQASRNWMRSLPLLGSLSGLEAKQRSLEAEINEIKTNGKYPESNYDWLIVAKALKRAQLVSSFQQSVWGNRVRQDGWPSFDFTEPRVVSDCSRVIQLALEVKKLESSLCIAQQIEKAAECQRLDLQRGRLQTQIRRQAEELVDTAVVAELSKSFSPDAESALIRFAQIAGANKFGKSSRQSKMTQRQRRRRQEYLDAFDKCCRFIPCWILTTSQISDYLPPECLFDLVIIDEASQSDITVLPGMLRGRQWLIVGDGKQVSPTESFVSEESIDTLRASLPESPFERSLMPGQSFFDLCAQAFPRGRVVLSEHFRCSPDIIDFSNQQFYDGRLVPLRLPSQHERLSPSIMDVKVNGRKSGKVNEIEADKIIELIQDTVNSPTNELRYRSIGVISLIGDEQTRLIRGRLLDVIGPEKMARHNVLVGDPPSFQGAERDIIFLSMVCSPGSVPTQSQLMHFQRANVAMSRARDRCVLVRSIDLRHISSLEDVKVPIIKFFLSQDSADHYKVGLTDSLSGGDTQQRGANFLKKMLQDSGYAIADMGVVWKFGICVEGRENCRAALIADGEELCRQDWQASYNQQKAIERVGWKCLRVDSLSLFSSPKASLAKIVNFLDSVGVERDSSSTNSAGGGAAADGDEMDDIAEPQDVGSVHSADEEEDQDQQAADTHDVVTISSEDDNNSKAETDLNDDRKPAGTIVPEPVASSTFDTDDGGIHASQFGRVVALDFLRQQDKVEEQAMDIGNENEILWDNSRDMESPRRKQESPVYLDDDDFDEDDTNDEEPSGEEVTKSKYRRLDGNHASPRARDASLSAANESTSRTLGGGSEQQPQPIHHDRSSESSSLGHRPKRIRKYRNLNCRVSFKGQPSDGGPEWDGDADSDLPESPRSEPIVIASRSSSKGGSREEGRAGGAEVAVPMDNQEEDSDDELPGPSPFSSSQPARQQSQRSKAFFKKERRKP